MRHQNWRDLQEWKSEGLELSTTSNEASKLYDATISQLMGWYDEPQVGGIESSLEKLYTADPDFVLGRALSTGLKLIATGTSVNTDSDLKSEIEELTKMAQRYKNVITDREYKHVQAILNWSEGSLVEAARIWEDVLAEFPTDIHALKFVYEVYFYLGSSIEIRDCVARVLPIWEQNKSLPLKGYLHGMAAFGLEETNLYERAEKEARKGLELNALDGWSTHSLAHVFEMEGRTQEGLDFLNSTVQDWTSCNYLACHNYWHVGLYHIERSEFDCALNVFETEISKRALNSKGMLDIADATSFLYRLDLASPDDESRVNLDEKWNDIFDICQPHLSDQILGFNDAHFMMACLGSKHRDSATALLKSASTPRSSGVNHSNYVAAVRITTTILQAMVDYNDERYEQVVDGLSPFRYKITEIGGSHAQRDAFHQLLICASIRSNSKCHRNLALQLLRERKYLKDVSPLTDRYVKMFNLRN